MMNNHHIAGLPEWADDETAAMAAEACGGYYEAAQAKSADLAAHRAAARFYWASAAKALAAKDFSAMRAMAKQAESAEYAFSGESSLLGAVFGAHVRPAEGRAASEGDKIAQEAAAQAKAAVKAEMATFNKKAAAARAEAAAEAAAARRAAIQAERSAINAAREAASAALPNVGEKVVCTTTHSLRRATSGIALLNGDRVEVVGFAGVDLPDIFEAEVVERQHSIKFGKPVFGTVKFVAKEEQPATPPIRDEKEAARQIGREFLSAEVAAILADAVEVDVGVWLCEDGMELICHTAAPTDFELWSAGETIAAYSRGSQPRPEMGRAAALKILSAYLPKVKY